jgi:hypothetical protein
VQGCPWCCGYAGQQLTALALIELHDDADDAVAAVKGAGKGCGKCASVLLLHWYCCKQQYCWASLVMVLNKT